jgi:excisionase family DNA binding protein
MTAIEIIRLRIEDATLDIQRAQEDGDDMGEEIMLAVRRALSSLLEAIESNEKAEKVLAPLRTAATVSAFQKQGPKFMTIPEVAEAARVPVNTVYAWIASGKLPSSKPGRRRLIREDVLDALLSGKPLPGVSK